ncbi:MAG TPA: HEAT repeat domain-containing protein [Gemmatimonadaceae bacterium]|nr:HEAT repeat domain-containing protein [Gemmatimonadaceae bacterium]
MRIGNGSRGRAPRQALAACAAAMMAIGAASSARAQSLAQRVAAVRDGRVQLRYRARPGVCGDGRGSIGTGGDTYFGNITVSDGMRPVCAPGPARVVLTMRDGAVDRVRTYVNGNDATATDIGEAPPREAAEWLLSLAPRLSGESGSQAILGAVVADSATVWPSLLRIARAHELPRATRESATFWLSRAAAAQVNGTDLFADHSDRSTDDDEDVRAQAVFALSQQPKREAVPALTRIARTNRDPRIRGKALFWLGQVGGDAAVDVFEGILRGR